MAAWWPNPKAMFVNLTLPSSSSPPTHTNIHTPSCNSPQLHTQTPYMHPPPLISSVPLQHSSRIHYIIKCGTFAQGHEWYFITCMCHIRLQVLNSGNLCWQILCTHRNTTNRKCVHNKQFCLGQLSYVRTSVTDTISSTHPVWKWL